MIRDRTAIVGIGNTEFASRILEYDHTISVLYNLTSMRKLAIFVS